MGTPAARIMDPTAHGGMVSVGYPTVIIGNMPASRIGDMHICPMVTGVVPHVGGPFILGAFNVLVGMMPQSRVGDMLICVGPPDALVMGCPTVMVGMAFSGGFSAVMMGLMMAGAAVLKGLVSPPYPRSVLVNGQVVTQYNAFITIEGTPEFQAKAVRDLNIIAGTESGKKLLKSLADSGKSVRIHTDRQVDASGKVKTGNWAWTDPPPSGKAPYAGYKGGGPADTQVGYDPDRTKLSGPPGSPYNTASWAQEPNRPADVGLYHELVHCDDMAHGKLDNSDGTNLGPKAGTPIENSELRAAGLPPYDKEDYSENTYRSDRGLDQRTFY